MKANNIYKKYIKRLIDIIMSVVAIVLLIPIYIIMIIVLYVIQGKPIFFIQKRMGLKGKEFKIYKFRTMKNNAEELIQNFTKEEKELYEKNYKLKNDNRITSLGKILRKTSLDELPQFINILKGDMSLIGPRPIVIKELEKYKEKKEEFLSVRPGLIGYWQAYSKEDTTYEERIEMELYYIRNESFVFDIKIFFKSIITVIKKAINN